MNFADGKCGMRAYLLARMAKIIKFLRLDIISITGSPSTTMKLILLLLSLSLSALAEENLFTVGVDTRCIYGLAPCWGKVREPISLVDGVSWVSDTATSTEWTGQFKTVGGKLPDVEQMKELMHRFNGDQFTYRALEGTLNGKVEKRSGVLFFKLDAGSEVRLAALKTKVQWDVKKRADFELTRGEKVAFSKLRVELKNKVRMAKITGPLRAEGAGWVMEVREFTWK